MTRSRFRVLLTMVLLIGMAAGCTSVSSGDPRPAESTTIASDRTTTTSAPPTRPREIKLDGIDPCTLLPEAAYTDFELNDEPGKPGKDNQGADYCLWQGDLGYMGATLVTYERVEVYEERYVEFGPTDPIDYFPAYTITLPRDDSACFVAVDVADAQYVKIQVGLDFAPTDRPICDYAHDFATSIMSTLVKR